jgi:protein TonB
LAFSLPLAASIIGHGCLVVLVLLFVGRVTPIVLPSAPKPAIEIVLAPPPVVQSPLPDATPPVTAIEPPPEPPPPAVETEPPPLPRSKPVVVKRPPPVRRPPPEPLPSQAMTPVAPPPAPVQSVAIPQPAAPPPAPLVSATYRAALAGWLESHKHYPENARERGEAGQAVLRFHVERSGRVLDYAVVKSTGYPDLDAAIDRMMQTASLPPFPADMSASDIEVSVTIRFALAR